MKHGITHRNAVEIDSASPLFNFLYSLQKLLYLVCQTNRSASPFGAATHSLRNPGLYLRKLVA